MHGGAPPRQRKRCPSFISSSLSLSDASTCSLHRAHCRPLAQTRRTERESSSHARMTASARPLACERFLCLFCFGLFPPFFGVVVHGRRRLTEGELERGSAERWRGKRRLRHVIYCLPRPSLSSACLQLFAHLQCVWVDTGRCGTRHDSLCQQRHPAESHILRMASNIKKVYVCVYAWEGEKHTGTEVPCAGTESLSHTAHERLAHIHTHTSTYIYTYTCLCVSASRALALLSSTWVVTAHIYSRDSSIHVLYSLRVCVSTWV